MITRHEIDSSRQNKVKYVVEDTIALVHDLLTGPERELIFDDYLREGINEILLRRGVYKWLAVRRDLIRYKNKLKDLENIVLDTAHQVKILGRILGKDARTNPDYLKLRFEGKGLLKSIQSIRKDLWDMIYNDRLRAPDNDRMAQEFVNKVLRDY